MRYSSTLASLALFVAAGISAPASDIGQAFTGGHATYFYQNDFAGACGVVNPDSASIAALSIERYGSLSTASPNCGRTIKVTNTANGHTVEAVVADGCPTCSTANDLDLSVGAFQQLSALENGDIPITWEYLN
ncbi:RlpA-like double-psi beta-barrel-protein domain-containing protein-containing protein [Daedaleopsis nitida]|nr:RlpA-like double-psi beta-barrel-protein domain-containing protein-containing protein [Daedaleopsis nitida]